MGAYLSLRLPGDFVLHQLHFASRQNLLVPLLFSFLSVTLFISIVRNKSRLYYLSGIYHIFQDTYIKKEGL